MNFVVLTKTSGFLGPIADILGYIMDLLFRFTSSMGILNIGLCIILFTLVIKLLMFPLTIKQQKSSKLMSVMQPELQAIQKKYKGKTDQDSMMKMNVETKAVYEKYGTSMTGGCLQLVIQLPILFALYRVIYNIPAYVGSVRVYFENVVQALPENYQQTLQQFAADQKINLLGGSELVGLTEQALDNKVIDILYKLNPIQWGELERLFTDASKIIADNAQKIMDMNSFLGINLATAPWSGGFAPNLAWLIPIAAGLSQWYSTKLMTAAQSPSLSAEENPMAQSMKTMNTVMPLMSAFFCFTFPAGIGVYWVASSVFQIIQQMIVNSYMNKIDLDEMIQKNVEKANAKRAKKGLPPAKIAQNASTSIKSIQAAQEKEEKSREEKIAKTQEIIKESTDYYNANAKPGSLASKVNMVKMYNEKHNK